MAQAATISMGANSNSVPEANSNLSIQHSNTITSNGTDTSHHIIDTLGPLHFRPSFDEMDPDLAEDPKLREDLLTVSRAFEARLKALRMAYEMAQQKLITEARLRQTMPFDVDNLMAKAAEHGELNRNARTAMREAAAIPELREIVESVEDGTFPTSIPATTIDEESEQKMSYDDGSPVGKGMISDGSPATNGISDGGTIKSNNHLPPEAALDHDQLYAL